MSPVKKQGLDIHCLTGLIPPARAAAFIRAAGGDPVKALKLHDWNEAAGAAFYAPLQKVELGLKVKVASAMAATYGPAWFVHPAFVEIDDWSVHNEIATTTRRLMAAGLPVDGDGMMEKASFGLWAGLLRGAFNPPVWMNQLRPTFPALPTDRKRHDLATLASRAVSLRNRIDHHEALIGLDLSLRHADTMQLLKWIDPALQARARGACTILQLLRAKP